MAFLLFLCLTGDDETLRVDGPPFLAFGGEAEFEAATTVEGATAVWRIADAPGGAVRAVETEPEFSSNDHSIRAEKIKVKSVGKTEGDLRLSLTIEKGGRRVATLVHVVRLGPAIRLPARFRFVDHEKGGSTDRDRITDAMTEKVNRIWKACGIEFEFGPGDPVKGRDAWFDGEGRFQPVIRKDGKRERSPALVELLQCGDASSINLFVVRDCHWTEKGKGLGDATVEHSLAGVGFEAQGGVFDESADATVIAHELGHVLGLFDLAVECAKPEERPLSERRRLMFSVNRAREGNEFTSDEMKTSRAVAEYVRKRLK